MLKENIVLKWVHRYGIDSLNDLLIHIPASRENKIEEENQELIKLELSKTFENIEEKKLESNLLETSTSSRIFSKDQNPNNMEQFTNTRKLPLPNIKNLRKWINNDKKAS